jgi:hypothetical protein
MNGNDAQLFGLKCIAGAILFALCGGLSAALLQQFPSVPGDLYYLFPIPFAALCTLLFMRKPKGLLVAVLMVTVWPVAFAVAFEVGAERADYRLPGCVGGLVGALGLVLCASICHRSFLSLKYLAIAALIGSTFGLAFSSWTRLYYATDLNRGPSANQLAPMYAFAIWQACVGTYLYGLYLIAPSDKGSTRREPEHLAN